MPCNTIRLSTINLANVDMNLLKDGLEALGFRVYLDTAGGLSFEQPSSGRRGVYQNGKLTHDQYVRTGRGEILTQDKVKQAYSGAVVKSQAKRFGWAIRETGDNQFVVVRR